MTPQAQAVFLIVALVLALALLAKVMWDMFSRRRNNLGAEMATQYIRNREILAEGYRISSGSFRSLEEASRFTERRS